MEAAIVRQTLERALSIVGGEARLARRLLVPRRDLRSWLSGDQRPPTPVFLAMVDIVVGSGKPIHGDLPTIERRRAPRPQFRGA